MPSRYSHVARATRTWRRYKILGGLSVTAFIFGVFCILIHAFPAAIIMGVIFLALRTGKSAAARRWVHHYDMATYARLSHDTQPGDYSERERDRMGAVRKRIVG
jgi:hypothetical protein